MPRRDQGLQRYCGHDEHQSTEAAEKSSTRTNVHDQEGVYLGNRGQNKVKILANHDGWLDVVCHNDSFMLFTLSCIDDAWDVVNILLSCSKKSGTTMGEDFVRTIEGFVASQNYDIKEFMFAASRTARHRS